MTSLTVDVKLSLAAVDVLSAWFDTGTRGEINYTSLSVYVCGAAVRWRPSRPTR